MIVLLRHTFDPILQSLDLFRGLKSSSLGFCHSLLFTFDYLPLFTDLVDTFLCPFIQRNNLLVVLDDVGVPTMSMIAGIDSFSPCPSPV